MSTMLSRPPLRVIVSTPTPDTPAPLELIREKAGRASHLERELVSIRMELHDLIREAYDRNAPVKSLVGATGYTRARIYQIANQEPAPAASTHKGGRPVKSHLQEP